MALVELERHETLILLEALNKAQVVGKDLRKAISKLEEKLEASLDPKAGVKPE